MTKAQRQAAYARQAKAAKRAERTDRDRMAAYARQAKAAKRAERTDRDRMAERAIRRANREHPDADRVKANVTNDGVTVEVWKHAKCKLFRYRDLDW